MTDKNQELVTPEGLEKLQQELAYLTETRRKEVADRIRQAREFGDISENSEYDEAKNEQGLLERRIGELSEEKVPRPDDEARRAQLDDCFKRCWERFESAAPSHALVMSWIVEDGLSHEEIAELLDRTPAATREFISQCRKRARVHLAEWYELAFGAG